MYDPGNYITGKKVLVIGSGGREHALVWKIAQSPEVEEIFCAPGNAGIADLATCVPIDAEDIYKLLDFAKREEIDLTVVGPEVPLAKGIVDIFEKAELKAFGPSQAAAEIEASKSFAKGLMDKYGIPTAECEVFTSIVAAMAYVEKKGAPIVVKANGLASGKGVFVCDSKAAANEALYAVLVLKKFGDAKVVIEECLRGQEASFLAFTDGKTVLALPSSQDHKAIFDGDKGQNTGGMGAYSPAPVVSAEIHEEIMEQVMQCAVDAMDAEGRKYKGVLYAGLMIDEEKSDGKRVKVLEFNCRFGDPEAQPLMMRLQSDIVPIMMAVCEERLHECALQIDDRAAVCVVMASGGYPGKYKKELPISGLDEAGKMEDTFVFHAGTEKKDGEIIAIGGRVLGVTSLGGTLKKAIKKAYATVGKIYWEGVYFRKDIGHKGLNWLEK